MKELLRLFPSLLLILSCSVTPPKIKEVNWDIKLIKDMESREIYESLSLFMNIADEDSAEDVKEILLIDDKRGIHWELFRDNWILEEREDKWYGSNSIIMPDRSPIPRDSMRIFVRDRAGESIETKLYITKGELEPREYKFPELRISGSKLQLINSDKATIFCYSNLGELLFTSDISGEVEFRELFGEDPLDEELHYYLVSKVDRQVLEAGPFISLNDDSE